MPGSLAPRLAPVVPSVPSVPDTAPRIVLDSNVWIDILVFDDPHTRPIRAALECGALCALIDARCLGELAYVLDYPQFAKRAVHKQTALDTLARLTQPVELPTPDEVANDAAIKPLPQCKDRDDQKFVELAYRGRAQWLVSKDRAVLKLARRVERDFGFRIAQPARFVEACLLHDEASAPA
ncbi:putative toxin-antitoxin system toxin component, PIN family [Paraburkholderia sp. SOS3]|uniref:putative toxin-antitoxin system toxin component, PIN family n=1 Tax=Paraburkholderia sp. SOS3 TaxID=1926494 RepID=UPI0009F8AFD8|nr:putative toxin-antitoxin system toxin component, PIN family [Paraburkholderia sp. SOS3]